MTQVTAEARGARTPAPLPDGRIAFTTLGDDGWELRAVAPTPATHAEAALPAPSAPPAFDSAPAVPVRETGIARKDLETPGIVVQIGQPPRRIDLLTEISGVSFDEAR